MLESRFFRSCAMLCACVSWLAAPDLANSQSAARIAFMGRMVADMDESIAFYEAIGFRRDTDMDTSWREDAGLDRLLGIRGAEHRTAKMTINSNISGESFALYLHELRGIERKTISGYPATEPGAGHFGFAAADLDRLWSQLKSSGRLSSRTRTGELVTGPGQTRPSAAYMTDPDGLDIEVVAQRPAAPAAGGRPARPAVTPGLSHIGLVVMDVDKAFAFYGDALGGELPGGNPPQWMQADWIDDLIGGEGNVVRLNQVMFSEAAAPNARMRLELIEYQDNEKTVDAYGIADIGVGYAGFEVQDLGAAIARANAAGAQTVTRGGPVEREDGARAVLLRDPDTAAFVELIQRH